MKIFIYPGSFDPLTNGHMDIIRRAAGLCDRLVVAVLINRSKKQAFTAQERLEMIQKSLVQEGLPQNIEAVRYSGLLVDLYREMKASAVVRGLRSESDFRFEAEIAAANKLLLAEYETCLLPCRIDLAYTRSTIVREVATYGGDISNMVPGCIVRQVIERLRDPERGLSEEG